MSRKNRSIRRWAAIQTSSLLNASQHVFSLGFEVLIWLWRCFNLLSLPIHGFGHALMLFLVSGCIGYLTQRVILEHIPASQFFRGRCKAQQVFR